MFKHAFVKLVRGDAPEIPFEPLTEVERRGASREAVFRESVLTIEGCYKFRASITNLSADGARIAFVIRIDLPSRVMITEPLCGRKRWARVAWQSDGAAGLAFLEPA